MQSPFSVFALCACGSSSGDSDTPAASPVSLNVGTGGESGTYYGYTGILGTVIGQKTDVKLTVVATGGSKDNLVSMQDGMYDLATVQSDVMTYAYNGTNSFADSGKIDGFRVLCALYPETVQIVTTDPSLKTVEDLRGKRVCVGDVGSGTYFNAIDVFAAYDMTIAASKTVYMIGFDDAHMEKLLASCPWYAKLVLPAGTYTGFDEDCATITVKATLVCRADLDDDTAYTIVKTIMESKDDIAALHEKGNSIDLTFATEGIAVPFAAGAAKYFAENGITVETAG